MLVFVSQGQGISQLCLCLFHRGKVFLSCACVCFTGARYFSVVLVFVSQGQGISQLCLYLFHRGMGRDSTWLPKKVKRLFFSLLPTCHFIQRNVDKLYVSRSAECVPLVEFMLYHVFTHMPVESHCR